MHHQYTLDAVTEWLARVINWPRDRRVDEIMARSSIEGRRQREAGLGVRGGEAPNLSVGMRPHKIQMGMNWT